MAGFPGFTSVGKLAALPPDRVAIRKVAGQSYWGDKAIRRSLELRNLLVSELVLNGRFCCRHAAFPRRINRKDAVPARPG
jgi:hypothetical protein